MKKINYHDQFFKEVMSKKENAIDFLNNYLPKSILKQIDLSSIEIAKDSFIEEARQESYSDLLYKINFNGKKGYIYALFEHKSYPDKYTSFQLLKYIVQIWDLHIKQNGRKGKLPIILPLVIYHGKKQWKFGNDLLCIQENLIGHEKEQLNFQYQLYDLSKYSDAEIKGEIEIRIFLYLLKNIFRPKSDTVLESIVNLLDELSQRETGIEYIKIMIQYFMNQVERKTIDKFIQIQKSKERIEVQTTMTAAESYRLEGFQNGIQKGFQDGIQKGKRIADRKLSIIDKKRKLRTAINMYRKNFDLDTIVSLIELDKNYLERFFRKIKLT